VTFKGDLKEHMDFRDVVHATQIQMLKQFGENVFKGASSRCILALYQPTRLLPLLTGLLR
jgi:hypothetical protein